MIKLGQCQVVNCDKPAEYGIYRINPNGEKVWLYVCREYEQEIGDKNLYLQGYNPRTGRKRKEVVRCQTNGNLR